MRATLDRRLQSLRENLGDGEAATIAAGADQQWVIGRDEKARAKREATARVGEPAAPNR